MNNKVEDNKDVYLVFYGPLQQGVCTGATMYETNGSIVKPIFSMRSDPM